MYSKLQPNLKRPPQALPKELEDAWFHALLAKSKSGLLTEAAVSDVVTTIRVGRRPDYSRQGAAFTYLYYVANFAKVLRALNCVAASATALRSPTLRVLDLGCGAGASSAAVIQWLHQQHRNPKVELTLVDSCIEQLELFESLTGQWISKFSTITAKTYCDGAFQFLSRSEQKFDLILASYLICEVPAESTVESTTAFLDAAQPRLVSGGASIVIDDGGVSHSASIITNLGGFTFDYPKTRYYLGRAQQLRLSQMPKACTAEVYVNRTHNTSRIARRNARGLAARAVHISSGVTG